MIDLNEVAVFLKVVECGGFSAASRALGLPKATVSRKVANLEATLGIRLLQRTTRAVSLTDAGRRLYGDCSRALGAVHEATQALTRTQDVPSGILRISAPADTATFYFSDIVIDFARAFPAVDVELLLTDERLNLVQARVDVAFRTGQLNDSTLIARKLGAGQRLVCASPRYLEAAGVPRTPRDLRKHTAIVHGDSVDAAAWTLTGPKGKAVVRPKARLAVNSMAFVHKAAVEGLGLAVLPEAIAGPDLTKGRLVSVLEAWRPPSGGAHLVYASNRNLSAATRAFIDFAIEYTRAMAITAGDGKERSGTHSRRSR